ncbi:MAG: hypothetical protein COV36_03255 [Alphaproteobacteria bacterium CG11_big_fil_rev_8_21_14_0_20_44_7]|nr:MAG: hypothetical protein COV36_03255 [Alphaproteobacteria bacterium CG11_big_fil_rev_8_21_14_0_20_44_7]
MYEEFSNQSVRDLAWVIRSPELMLLTENLAANDGVLGNEDNFLRNLDKNPKNLEQYIHKGLQKRAALGKYFEVLIEYWLHHQPEFEILATNLQAYDGQTTVGEFDFLMLNGGKPLHLEVATKFYIGVRNSEKWDNWVGPRAFDRLDMKMDKLLNKQLQLAYSTAGKAAISEIFDKKPQAKLVFKGVFFCHYSYDAPKWPKAANPEHLKGLWCRFGELADLAELFEDWQIANKPHWFAPYIGGYKDFKQLFAEVESHFKTSDVPILLSAKNSTGEQKIFVTGDNWQPITE